MRKKIILTLLAILILAGLVYAFVKWQRTYKEEAPAAIEVEEFIKKVQNLPSENQQKDRTIAEDKINKNTPLPPELNLKMAFYAQAPLGDWRYPWQEACEEASILLVANTYHKHQWTREQFNEEILKLVEWEKKYFGSYEHTNMKQTAEILNNYLNLETLIHENPSYEDIQKILAKGHFIVMPVGGKLVKNPNYKNGGPMYHVFVIKGYKKDQKLISSDVGTRNGENYVYKWEIIEKALHDYAEPIEKGIPRIIEVLPPQ